MALSFWQPTVMPLCIFPAVLPRPISVQLHRRGAEEEGRVAGYHAAAACMDGGSRPCQPDDQLAEVQPCGLLHRRWRGGILLSARA